MNQYREIDPTTPNGGGQRRVLLTAGMLVFACLALLGVVLVRYYTAGNGAGSELLSLEAFNQLPDLKDGSQMLWGGDGLVTTGNYVDGRKTVPGLHTDCIPGLTPHIR